MCPHACGKEVEMALLVATTLLIGPYQRGKIKLAHDAIKCGSTGGGLGNIILWVYLWIY